MGNSGVYGGNGLALTLTLPLTLTPRTQDLRDLTDRTMDDERRITDGSRQGTGWITNRRNLGLTDWMMDHEQRTTDDG